LECKTYRFYDHVGRDFGVLQRDADEIAYWRNRDPIKLWREKLIEMDILSAAEADAITQEAAAEMDDAIAWAEHQPDPSVDELFTDIYS
jgi:pyruvate dehydrogenase E1 component alpha subunit